jgi:hypothetical protein
MIYLSDLSGFKIPRQGLKFHQVERTLPGPGGFFVPDGVHFYGHGRE